MNFIKRPEILITTLFFIIFIPLSPAVALTPPCCPPSKTFVLSQSISQVYKIYSVKIISLLVLVSCLLIVVWEINRNLSLKNSKYNKFVTVFSQVLLAFFNTCLIVAGYLLFVLRKPNHLNISFCTKPTPCDTIRFTHFDYYRHVFIVSIFLTLALLPWKKFIKKIDELRKKVNLPLFVYLLPILLLAVFIAFNSTSIEQLLKKYSLFISSILFSILVFIFITVFNLVNEKIVNKKTFKQNIIILAITVLAVLSIGERMQIILQKKIEDLYADNWNKAEVQFDKKMNDFNESTKGFLRNN